MKWLAEITGITKQIDPNYVSQFGTKWKADAFEVWIYEEYGRNGVGGVRQVLEPIWIAMTRLGHVAFQRQPRLLEQSCR
jgi:hypothetical protein